MKKILIISLAILLNGCASTIQTVSLNHREYDGIKEGLIHKDLGEPLIVAGIEKYAKGIQIKKGVNETINKMTFSWNINLQNGEILYYGGKDKSRDFYFSGNQKDTYKQGVAINRETNQKFIAIEQSQVTGSTYIVAEPYDFNYTESEYQSRNCNECFKKELVYNGKSGNIIKVIYREYINDLARPAFTQDLNYDLSEGNLISFKGCKIEVQEAKNTGIDFKILSSF